MPKKSPTFQLPLGPPNGGTRFRWLYDGIRSAVVDGTLAPGMRLPSTRSVACQYGVARGTVVAAFDQLVAEGYAHSRVGSGTFIRHTLPEPAPAAAVTARGIRRSQGPLSVRGRQLVGNRFPKLWSNRSVETFRLDRPALEAFPVRVWSRIAARRLRGAGSALLGGGEPLGLRPLREAIAGSITQERGVRCTADQVAITGGTQHSLDLIARLLLDPGDRVWMEDPGYAGATALLRAHGAQVVGVPVDEDGLDCAVGRRRAPLARLAYVTPSCQFPLGASLSLPRRMALLQWAQEADGWVFEDDYDGQLRFRGRPLAALQSLDTAGRVIYSNTFNKLLFPSLRIGFLVLPVQLIDAVSAARSITDRFPAVLEQATLCDFIVEGHMDQHLRRMRELYTERFDALIRCARRDLQGLMHMSPLDAGLKTVGWLTSGIDEDEACSRAADRGIDSVPLSRLTLERKLPPGLVLGVVSADIPAIRRGVRRLGSALREVRSNPPGAR
ncbi:MAG TPA: PLP-dependent aminotransferase family protein [Steroidobacteraceae bacterium]|nr:PLP-dependent aminotransferase family protein [Steroidobacteraceae bacterium]